MILKIWKSYRLTNVVIAFMTILGLFVFIQNQYAKYNYYFLVENAAAFWQIIMLVGGLLFMGNITNDYWDQKTDEWNGKTNNVFLNFNANLNFTIAILFWIIGLVGAILLSYQIDVLFLLYYLLSSALLLLYNYKLKKVAIIGNIVVALLTSSIVLLPFVLYNFSTLEWIRINLKLELFGFEKLAITLLTWCLFIMSFLFNLAREIVKDVIDKKGDEKMHYKTIAILFDEDNTRSAILIFHVILMFFCMMLLFLTLISLPIFITVALINMLLYFGYQNIYNKEYSKLSIIYKLSMGLGVLMLFF